MSMKDTLGEKWGRVKPMLGGLVIGLVLGPFITSFLGWQVTSSTMNDQVHEATIAMEAAVCDWRARQETPNPADLDFTAREDLAEKYATMPWASKDADYDVVSACYDKLARKQPADDSKPPA